MEYVWTLFVIWTLKKKRQTKNKKEKLFFGSFDPIRTYDTTFCVNLFFFEKFMKKKTSKKKTNNFHLWKALNSSKIHELMWYVQWNEKKVESIDTLK